MYLGKYMSYDSNVPLIFQNNPAESLDRRGIISKHTRESWLAISILYAANLRDAISTFSYVAPQRNGYQSKGVDVDEVVRLRKRSFGLWGCFCICPHKWGEVMERP